jgi:putative SOS response-associated peptidase YedK
MANRTLCEAFQPIVRLSRDTREREIVMMRWGLIPYWAKDPHQFRLAAVHPSR